MADALRRYTVSLAAYSIISYDFGIGDNMMRKDSGEFFHILHTEVRLTNEMLRPVKLNRMEQFFMHISFKVFGTLRKYAELLLSSVSIYCVNYADLQDRAVRSNLCDKNK